MATFIVRCSNKFGGLYAYQDVSFMWDIYFEIGYRVCGQNYLQSKVFSEYVIITNPHHDHPIVGTSWDRAQPYYTLQPIFCNTHFNIILPSKSYLPNFRLPSNFGTKFVMHFPLFRTCCLFSSYYLPWFDYPHNINCREHMRLHSLMFN
jgi:hypothetical protein